MSTTPFFTIMALPLTLVIIAAEIDLSFPSIMSLGMVAFTLTPHRHRQRPGSPWSPAWSPGLLAGLLNGFIVRALGIPSLVATIGTQFFWRGVVLVITGGNGTLAGHRPRTVVLHDLLVGRLFGKIPMQMLWAVVDRRSWCGSS